ncbi:MAG: MFS transporter [Ruminococcaceae bacterium]|nr:MFS transporter [Oscillospiraceae bacterium]
MLSILIVIYIVFISLGLPDSVFGVSWPVLHVEFGIPESFASVYSIIIGVCSGGVSFIAGRLLRKFGTANVTFFSILLTAIGLIGISFSPNIFVMMICAVIMGYGAGAIDTGLNNYISLHYEARHMSWLHCFWGLGVTISPLIMSIFLNGENGSWRNGYRILAIIQFSIAILVALSLKKWKKFEKQDVAEAPEEQSEKHGIIDILKIKGALTSILSQGLYCSMEFLIGTWGASLLVNSYGYSPDIAARWVSLYYGGIMLGRLISGFISIKASDNTLIRGGIVTAFAGMSLLALPIGNISVLGLLLIGIGFGPIFPSILHSVPYRFGSKYSADLTGFHMGGAYTIGFAVQLTFGYVATATTFKITPFVLLIFILLLFFVNEFTIKTIKKSRIYK